MTLTPEEQQELELLQTNVPDFSVDEQQELKILEQSLESDNFLDRTSRDLQNRENIAQDIRSQYQRGNIGGLEYGMQMAGKVGAGAVGDVAGQAIKSGVSMLSDIDSFLGGYGGKATGAAVDVISSIPTPSGKTLGEASGELFANLGDEYKSFAEKNPRAARNVEAATNLLMLGVPSSKYGDDILDSAVQTSKALTKKGTARMSADQVRAMGGALFEKADRIGGQLKPEFWDDYLNNLSKKMTRKSELGKGLEKATGSRQTLDKAIEALTEVQGNPQSLTAVKEADSILGELAESSIDSMGKYTREGKDFLQMQHTLRDMIEEAGDDMFVGGREAFDTVKEARKMWAAAYKMDDVERIISKAEGAQQPSTIVKNGFRRLRDNPKKFKKFTPEEQFAIKRAAKTGSLEAFIKLSGSGLSPIIAGSAGFATGGAFGAAAAIPAFAYRETMKGVADAMAATKGGRVLDVIQSQSVNQAPLMAAPYLRRGAADIAKTVAPIGTVQATQKETLAERARRLYGE